ncbi:GIY-YIG nuclease family protein [Neogemmobacter tilapiae]|uniref:Bacteriophage T5 Orf172 DNA-binding domain-containing protein n=1 Tax=Neogemmobacter tilapiae TaxID=875041 RepID=A0A918TWR7_9RHOB|nr:GIY-YIG nuclease family protein [Gemmobacter tilapiae]GHC66371.1 hypothetical protein GCM10007315_33850 [Gemmobacter tilapiae]
MLSRSDITDREFAFLVSQKILLSQVFDARGRGPATFHAEAEAGGYLFGMAKPCSNGHRLFTRRGHCIECNTASIAFIRRGNSDGYIYLAASQTGRILKIGFSADPVGRSATLNLEGGYGGFSDWERIAHSYVQSAGKIEFGIHRALEDLKIELPYIKNGRTQIANELFRGDLKRVWGAYREQVRPGPEAKSWRHPKLADFNFVP